MYCCWLTQLLSSLGPSAGPQVPWIEYIQGPRPVLFLSIVTVASLSNILQMQQLASRKAAAAARQASSRTAPPTPSSPSRCLHSCWKSVCFPQDMKRTLLPAQHHRISRLLRKQQRQDRQMRQQQAVEGQQALHRRLGRLCTHCADTRRALLPQLRTLWLLWLQQGLADCWAARHLVRGLCNVPEALPHHLWELWACAWAALGA